MRVKWVGMFLLLVFLLYDYVGFSVLEIESEYFVFRYSSLFFCFFILVGRVLEFFGVFFKRDLGFGAGRACFELGVLGVELGFY